MTKCVQCAADTQLYIGGIPVCLKCQEHLSPKDIVEDFIEPKTYAAHSS
jgi:hypothetical protein